MIFSGKFPDGRENKPVVRMGRKVMPLHRDIWTEIDADHFEWGHREESCTLLSKSMAYEFAVAVGITKPIEFANGIYQDFRDILNMIPTSAEWEIDSAEIVKYGMYTFPELVLTDTTPVRIVVTSME